MEKRILDFLTRTGKSTALNIAKALGVSRSIANKHLYSLEKSKRVKRTEETPPVWDLIETTDDLRSVLKPDTSENAVSEKKVSDILRSGGKAGLKAHQIARDLGQPIKTVKKHLYSLQDKGKAQRSENNQWINDDRYSMS